MKNSNKTQAIKMIEKFDRQLRDILKEELKSVRAAVVDLRNDNNLLVA
ncbi:MAG: hypothetical protein K0S09_907 [Sphingobacteriaceae bacterium]|jgi:hypothetical protein|nr:hypothetical protein [Sphingobacteriaceae bacterium]